MPIAVDDLIAVSIDPLVEGSSPRLGAILGVPEGPGPWPAVVVVHEVFGVDREMRKQVAHLASLGYLAVMPDLFSDGGARRCLVATMRAMANGHGRAYADIESARQWLASRPDVVGAIGIVGFCMGGGFALMTASRGFGAAAVNYGLLPAELDATLAGACPVVGSYGGRDRSLKGAAARLEQALTAASIPNDIKEYPEASHTFMNELRAGPGWFRPISRVMGFGPDPDAASDAWARIDDFLRAHLTDSPAQG